MATDVASSLAVRFSTCFENLLLFQHVRTINSCETHVPCRLINAKRKLHSKAIAKSLSRLWLCDSFGKKIRQTFFSVQKCNTAKTQSFSKQIERKWQKMQMIRIVQAKMCFTGIFLFIFVFVHKVEKFKRFAFEKWQLSRKCGTCSFHSNHSTVQLSKYYAERYFIAFLFVLPWLTCVFVVLVAAAAMCWCVLTKRGALVCLQLKVSMARPFCLFSSAETHTNDIRKCCRQ